MGHTVRVLLFLIAAQLCISQAAAAAKTDLENRKVMHDYARCVVKHQHDKASEAIVANYDNSIIIKRYPELISSMCLSHAGGSIQMTFGGDLYRYALADALVNNDFVKNGEVDFANRLPLAHLVMPDLTGLGAFLLKIKSKSKREELKESYSKQQIVAWLSRYGECVVRNDPVKAQLWLLTPPDGPEEISRINELKPSFATCLSAGTVKFDRVTMRGTVAINYYRLAMATPVPATRKIP